MDSDTSTVDATTNAFGLASWMRQRSDDELRSFVDGHHEQLAGIELAL